MTEENRTYITHLKVTDVPWHRLTTAYGRGTEFPAHLAVLEQMRDLASVKKSLYELTTNMEHQSILNPSAPDFEEQYWALRRMGGRFRVNHCSWWKQELPCVSEYEEAKRNLDRVDYKVDYIVTHCAPNNIVDKLGEGGYIYDPLTDFLENVREKASFHYWLFGHYHNNKIIDDRFVLLWEQMVQVL